MAVQSLLIMILVLALLLIFGVPIAISLAFSAIAAILPTLAGDITLVTAAQRIFSGTSTFSLLAIPFFVLAGNIITKEESPGAWSDLLKHLLVVYRDHSSSPI